jgi:hypothetical protein
MADQQQPCGCEEATAADSSVIIFQEGPGCTPIVSKQVCVEADVTITPLVTPGTPTVRCTGNPSFGRCLPREGFTQSTTGSCTFRVSQLLCVNIPINFDADVETTPGLVACGPESIGMNCEGNLPGGCTYTRGAWANRQRTLGLQLLANAGGSIVLGNDANGLSITVTSANYDAVITGTVGPSPQFRQLYTQLLAANLNVLNGATCPFIEAQIAIANNFLATTTEANNTTNPIAAAIQMQLELFNSGNAPGCPMHCGDDTP